MNPALQPTKTSLQFSPVGIFSWGAKYWSTYWVEVFLKGKKFKLKNVSSSRKNEKHLICLLWSTIGTTQEGIPREPVRNHLDVLRMSGASAPLRTLQIISNWCLSFLLKFSKLDLWDFELVWAFLLYVSIALLLYSSSQLPLSKAFLPIMVNIKT